MKKKIDELTQILASETISGLGLLSGIGGQILTCSELFLQNKVSHDWLSHLHNILEEKLSNEDFLFTHCGGLAGIGWLYEYLSQRKIINYDTNIILEDPDIYLEKTLKNFMLENNYDFLHGGVGVVLYFTKRVAKKKELIPVLAQFVEDLEHISIKQEDEAIKWRSFLLRHTNNQVYNISLSHGMSSIVSILSKLYKIEGIDKEKTEKLLRGAVQYILAQEIDKNKYGSYFTYYALESTSHISKSRLAWCYGDLGIASVLFQAGKALRENVWIDKALEIFIFAATMRQNLEDDLVKDAGLCHGTAGIGHIFYRMWWNTKLPEFKDAADYWFQETLKMATFKDGVAGFKAFEMQMPEGEPRWINKYEFLEGIAGINLAMLTYYYEMDPAWDECLLLS
ncbi:MAG: lanthionine synthetase C family protein [Bacteroidetes bacterium]|nr:lanthionine synthetase C family protein [Bacteroidota bacterium]MCL2303511.1 lanthionine synthetase C family protein [Lentimicrobiaceae bacterium]